MKPLADRLRPKDISDMVGQNHIVGKNKIINKLLENNTIPNMILYGPPGTGKTTLANIIANCTNNKGLLYSRPLLFKSIAAQRYSGKGKYD